MNLTQEQLAIIHSTGNIKINAVAGSGKTSTIIEYAKARPSHSRILYLAFNKSVKIDAVKKFEYCKLTNVKVETAHSLAYKRVIFSNQYKVNNYGYKTHEIAEMLGISGSGEKHGQYIIANHINKFIAYFCNSNKMRIEDLDYLEVVKDPKARSFVKSAYNYIQSQASLLLQQMDTGEIAVTHDFYLKKFQLGNPRLPYDYILFDEAQDASAVMLDIFLKQKATKVIVGDTHQQIYGWRYAINSLEQADFKEFHLSTSFRFDQDVANLAMGILKWKAYFVPYSPFFITGKGQPGKNGSTAVIARTNLGLLLQAISYIKKRKEIKHIYFEGNISSYAYADDGTSLYDVLHLFANKHYLIKDRLIKQMRDIAELEEYIEHTEDVQLSTMVEIVKEYKHEIADIIKEIKHRHVEKEEKEKADVIFSTVHRCKGMEYDHVILANDFITEERLKKIIKEQRKEDINTTKLNEEINLLYVAVTRTSNMVQIPASMMPAGILPSSQINIVAVEEPEDQDNKTVPVSAAPVQREKAYTVEAVRLKYTDAYQPWTTALDNELTLLYCKGTKVKAMATHFGRTDGAIRSRIKKLELEAIYGKKR